MKYIILGTAGHIDHGKSSLVKALTGIDPDRLKEEQRDHELPHPVGDRFPGHQNRDRGKERGQGDKENADAVDPYLVLYVPCRDPGPDR